ncbi:MAG TPA: peptide ABC transporter permease, partial [Firmicutes bacterium]|nr:peptide ABC transporter permease [Bacillota bacterium]
YRIYMIMVILGFLNWPGLARLIRAHLLLEREKDFVLAARALGVKQRNIMVRHILP